MKILMIGAHQDDAEFEGCGLAILLRQGGHDVRFLSCCNGSGGHREMTPAETVARRAGESRAVAKYLDIEYEVWSDMDDCSIVADLATRRRMIRYIRNYGPDVIITHRTNDYHADHRAVGQLVQDAAYLLIVPHECPDAPAMRREPVILFFEDPFTEPPFHADIVLDIDTVIEKKFRSLSLNESQVYEWLPYTHERVAPPASVGKEARFDWMVGERFTPGMSDEEIMQKTDGYGAEFARTAVRFRKELITRYGEEHGRAVRYAEAFGISEYGAPFAGEVKELLDKL